MDGGAYAFLLRGSITFAELFQPAFFFLLEVWEFFDFGLVEPVDDGVFAFFDEDFLDFFGVFKADLADGHASIFFQVRPWGVDDVDVVFFVACLSRGCCKPLLSIVVVEI